jgi:hypothetical protein
MLSTISRQSCSLGRTASLAGCGALTFTDRPSGICKSEASCASSVRCRASLTLPAWDWQSPLVLARIFRIRSRELRVYRERVNRIQNEWRLICLICRMAGARSAVKDSADRGHNCFLNVPNERSAAQAASFLPVDGVFEHVDAALLGKLRGLFFGFHVGKCASDVYHRLNTRPLKPVNARRSFSTCAIHFSVPLCAKPLAAHLRRQSAPTPQSRQESPNAGRLFALSRSFTRPAGNRRRHE